MIGLGLLAVALAAEPQPADAGAPRILEQKPLTYPDLARELPLPPVRCVLALALDATGRLLAVEAPSCPRAFADAARRDLASWRFAAGTARGHPVAARLDLSVRWQLDPDTVVPSPDPAQWTWTDHALARLGQQDLVLGVSSAGLAVVGAALVGLAVWGAQLRTYRARYVGAGIGLALGVTFGISAAVHLDNARRHRAQRALWATFRPVPTP